MENSKRESRAQFVKDECLSTHSHPVEWVDAFLPVYTMYRSRLGKNLGKITLDYVSSISDDVEIAHYDILGSQAHVIMLYENKIIAKNVVSAVPKKQLNKKIFKKFIIEKEEIPANNFIYKY